MNAIHPTRDALNALKPTPRAPATWQGAANVARAGAKPQAAFDLNAATSPAHSFRAALDAISTKPKEMADAPEDAALRKTAETLVNQLFVGTMLKRMRDSPFKDPTFSGGQAGQAYAGLFDQRLAEHAGGGIADRLVGSIVKQLKRSHGDPRQLYADPRHDAKVKHDADAKRDADVKKQKAADHDALAAHRTA